MSNDEITDLLALEPPGFDGRTITMRSLDTCFGCEEQVVQQVKGCRARDSYIYWKCEPCDVAWVAPGEIVKTGAIPNR